jgi:uncharacterized membrane protein
MFDWLTGTDAGKMCATFFLSMLPVGELRLGLPYGIALGLEYPLALMAALLGNMIPVPFIIVYIKRIFEWMRKHMPKLDALVTRMETRADTKGDTVREYGHWALLLFVAIPLPGTGAWTGTLAASILDMDFKTSILAVMGGVALAGVIIGVLCTLGFGALFGVV